MVYMIHQLKKLFVTHVKELIYLSRVTRTIKQKRVSVQEKAQCAECFIQTRSTFRCGGISEHDTGDPHHLFCRTNGTPKAPSISWYSVWKELGQLPSSKVMSESRFLQRHVGAVCNTTTVWPSSNSHFSTRWCTTTLGFRSEMNPGQDIPRTLDRKGRSNCMASQIPRHDTPGLLFVGAMLNTKCIALVWWFEG